MNRTFRVIYLFVLVVGSLGLSTSYADDDKGDGGQAGAFLRIGLGARALSMGRAFTAVADDPSAGYWNPAGLVHLNFVEIAGTYSILTLDRKYNYAGIGIPSKGRFVFAFNWVGLGVADIEGRTKVGHFTNYFNNQENAYLLSWAMKLHETIGIGVSAKYLSHNLSEYQSTGYGFDAGVIFKPFSFLKLGYQFRNISSKVKWDTQSKLEETYPQSSHFGICLSPFQNNTKFSFDVVKVANQKMKIHAGLEFPLLRYFGLRCGYDRKRVVGGAYIALPIDNKQLIIDYCIGQDPIDKTMSHRISLRLKMARDRVEINPPLPLNADKLSGSLKLMFEKPDAVISRKIENYSRYALINCGIDHGYKDGMKFQVYRAVKVPGRNEESIIMIARVHIVKAQDKMSAILVDWMKEGSQLKVGDYVFLQRKEFSVIR